MYVDMFSSGSNGNCTLVQHKKTTILIDIGKNLSLKQIVSGMMNHSLSLFDVDAIFITHSHIDHIGLLYSFSKRYNAKIYMEDKCFKAFKKRRDYRPMEDRIQTFSLKNIAQRDFIVDASDDMIVYAHRAYHDTPNVCYRVDAKSGESYGHITDTGHVDEHILDFMKDVNVLAIESNYDFKMTVMSDRPGKLKNRVLSGAGHLSNEDTMRAIKKIYMKGNGQLKKVITLHTSLDCNRYEKIDKLFKNMDISENIELYKSRQQIRLGMVTVEKPDHTTSYLDNYFMG